jgi:hypothetical protein
MRYVCAAAAIALSALIPSAASGQTPVLSITNYQLVSETRQSRTVFDYVYRADLVNNGPARSAVTAAVASSAPNIQVIQGSLHFVNVPVGGRVTSSDHFTIRVDRTGAFDFSSLQWTFPPAGAPMANAGPDQTRPVGTTVMLNGSGSSNPGGVGTLSFSWAFTSRPAGSGAVLNNPLSVTPTFVTDVAGTYDVMLMVSNGLASDSSSVRISTGNTPPVANAGANRSVSVGATVALNGSGSIDVDGDPLSYSWTLTQRPAGSSAVLAGAANSIVRTFTADRPGTYAAQLIVNDGKVDSAPSGVIITTQNTPPVANAGASQTVTARGMVQLNGSASTDVDGDPLTYRWSLIAVPGGSTAALSNPTAVNPTFTADKVGLYVAQLIVSDGKVNGAPSMVTITTQNTAPVARAGSARTVSVNSVVQLSGATSTDVDGDALTWQWSLITVPAGSTAALNNTTGVNPTFTADLPGTYVAQLIVNDGKVNSAPATVTIATNSQQAPAANAGLNQTVKHGSLVTLNGSGTDPQGRALTFQWSLLNKPADSSAAMSGNTAARPTFTADVPGNYVAQLIVNNGLLSSPPATVTVTTTNTAPVANAGPEQTVTAGSAVTLSGDASSDADNDPLSYAWSLTSKPASSNATMSAAGSAGPTFVADEAGVYVAQLIVSDQFTSSAPNTVTITVQNRGTILLSGQTAVGLRQSLEYPVSLSAPAAAGGLTVSLTVSDSSKVNLPAATVFIAEGATQPESQPTITGLSPGGSQIGASGRGYTAASERVQVTATITFVPAALTINGVETKNADLGLSGPAPAGGLTITLASSNTGVATVPESVVIPEDKTTVAVPVTSISPGTAAIRASAPNVPEAQAVVTVNRADIILPANSVVPPGNSMLFPVVLAKPAQGPTFIALVSSDASKVTVSQANILINAGQTQPAAAPRVSGISGGAATITATAIGLNTAETTVRVGYAVSFVAAESSPVSSTGTQNLLLRLSGPAPQNGLTLALTSSNPGVATVPAAVIFGATATQAIVPVTGVAPGTTIITASSPDTGEASTKVTVEGSATIILPASTTVAAGQSVPFPVSLSTPAPAGGVTITLASNDSAKLLIAPQEIAIAAGQSQPSAPPTVIGVSPGAAAVRASAPGYASVTRPVQINTAPAQIAATGGTPQSATAGTSFTAPLVVVVRDASGNPVRGAVVTFTAPSSGPGGSFAGGVSTATTNGAGLAAAPAFTANQLAGSYVVTASVTGVAAQVTFSLTNTPAVTTDRILITSATVGQNLQTAVVLTLPQPAPEGGMRVTIASGNPSSMLVAGRPGDAGSAQILVTVGEGIQTVGGIYVQGLASSGTVSLTATAANGFSGTATIALTPSGFVLAGPNGMGGRGFSTTAGSSSQFTLAAARLDNSLAYVETQQVRGGASFTVDITGAFSSIGAVAPSPFTMYGGQASGVITFSALASGNTRLAASVPDGFSLPAQGANSLEVSVASSTLLIPNLTVGRNMQVPATIRMTAPAPGSGVMVTVASSDAGKVLFSGAPDREGSESITLVIPGGRTSTPEFYVQAMGSGGPAAYTAVASGFGTASGTISVGPSGFVLHGPFGLGMDFFTTTGTTSDLTVYPALLDSSMNIVELQQVRGGLSVDADVKSSNLVTGTITTSPVRLNGGDSYATTHFQPASSGSTVLSVSTGAGYNSPSRYRSLTATVKTPGIGVEDKTIIGKHLQSAGTILLGEAAPPEGLPVTLTTNSVQLLFSQSATTAGSSSVTITIPAGQTSAFYFMQSLAAAGTASYTVSASGYSSRTASVQFAPSGVVIAGPLGLGFPLSATVGGNHEATVFTALLDPDTNGFVMPQPVAGGRDLTVVLTSSDADVLSVQSMATVRGGLDSTGVPFTPLRPGSAAISVTAPDDFTMPRQYTSFTVLVNDPDNPAGNTSRVPR